jgi:FkbM family methyltransferase
MGIANTLEFIANHPLTKSRRVRAMARVCVWQIRSILQDEIIVPYVGSAWLAARRGMHAATGNIYVGLHEFADMAFVLHTIRPDDLFVDVGANIGSYTLLASAVCGSRTIACEPAPESIRALRRNIAINGIGELVEIHETAVGAAIGRARLTVGLGSGNYIATLDSPDTQEVALTPLDAILGNRCPALIKIDTEGYEMEVLAGAHSVLNISKLNAIIVEGADTESSYLNDFGFSRCSYDPFGRSLARAPNELRGQVCSFAILTPRKRLFALPSHFRCLTIRSKAESPPGTAGILR